MSNPWSSTECWEVHNSQHTSITLEGVECEVKVQCDWANRHKVAMDLMGMRSAYEGSNPDPSLYSPRKWPYMSAGSAGGYTADGQIKFSHAPICYSVGIGEIPGKMFLGCGVTNDTQSYDQAIITAKFSSSQESKLIAEEIEYNSDFLKMDYSQFAWESDAFGLTQEQAPDKLYHSVTLRKTLYRRPTIPTTLLSLVGTVNNAAYLSADNLVGIDFAIATLLFKPAVVKRTIGLDGSPAWNIMLRFEYKPQTWNRFWRSDTGNWDLIDYADDGSPADPYILADFSNFFVNF